MNSLDPLTQPPTSTNCDSSFSSGSVTLTLDAPLAPLTPTPLPLNFRSMTQLSNIKGSNASGSAQYSWSQVKWMISNKNVTFPLVLVDLRQESHGYFNLQQKPFNNEQWIAVSWFAERDWANVAKGLPSIMDDEHNNLMGVLNHNVSVYQITSKTPESGICTATANPVQVGGVSDELGMVGNGTNMSYLRLPTTDHCRPVDSIVDQFIQYENNLPANTWLHFHCRGGDGRTTTFMTMHDIFHNASTPLSTIVTRQHTIGGVDLTAMPDQTSFKYPFAKERWTFIQNFYEYVVTFQPGGFQTTWSEWVTRNAPAAAEASASA